MATKKQVAAAKRNVKKAQAGARSKRSIANMPKATKSALGKQGAAVGAEAPWRHDPQDTRRAYAEAKRRNLPGRSKMGATSSPEPSGAAESATAATRRAFQLDVDHSAGPPADHRGLDPGAARAAPLVGQ